ncbi:MAG: helix-turn-helix domain-containing protein [Psychrilyobacter sp.]|uniref:helix-turn-helix domain-containing protein n=1 Tax=Psychrilyobacter sp. TaxID=2586924 RepID=UPI003C7274F6
MDKYTVAEEKRVLLSKVIKKKRKEKKLGLNQLALKTGVQKSLISRLENALILKINPHLIKLIAGGLDLDYKKLYKIVGYLDEDDYSEENVFEKVKEETELSKFTELINSLPRDYMKKMLREYLEKVELEAYKNGTFEEKKGHFNLIRKAIDNGVEE